MGSHRAAFESVNSVMQRYFPLFILACFAAGGLFSDTVVGLKPAVTWLFAAMTLMGALRVSVREIKGVLLSPLPIVTALVVLHVAYPAAIYLLGKTGILADPDLYIGLALLASVPTGVSTIMWVTTMRGNVALGLTLITLDSILSPVIVPFTVMLLVGTMVSFDAGSLMSSLVKMIVIPTVIGVVIHEISNGRAGAALAPYGAVFSKLALGAIIAINVAASWSRVAAYTGSFVFLFGILLVTAVFGFAVAYCAARAVIRDRADSMSVTFVAGMRNISAGVVLAMESFDPLVSIPVTGAILFQQPIAAIVARLIQGNDARGDQLREDSQDLELRAETS